MAYEKELGKLPDKFYRGAGCNFCAGTGYLGQCGLFEILTPTEEIKRLLISGADKAEIRDRAINEGTVPLMRDGMLKVKDGITTVTEVLRNLYSL